MCESGEGIGSKVPLGVADGSKDALGLDDGYSVAAGEADASGDALGSLLSVHPTRAIIAIAAMIKHEKISFFINVIFQGEFVFVL